jgi:UDP:flavonoid glycosyltransferase YjiC (YdhE family)
MSAHTRARILDGTHQFTSEEHVMRVLFTTTPGLGHFHPLVPLMHAARARGDDVHVVVAASGQPEVSAFGFPTVVTPDPPPEVLDAFWSRLFEHEEPDTAVIGRYFGGIRTRASLVATRVAVDDLRPDLVVSENAEFAGLLAAEIAGIPHVTVGVTSMDMAGFSPQLLVDELNIIRREVGLAETSTVPWAHRTRFATPVPPLLWGSPDAAPEGAVVYQHEDPEGPAPATLPMPRAAGSRPRVYATLGSVAGSVDFAMGTYAPMLAALGEIDADVLFTIGRLDPARLGPVPGNVKVERYVPQQVAMACDAVVTHGGAGSTVAALSRGLPQVFVPLFADQPHNAALVEAAGAGIRVPAAEVAQRLPAAVRSVLDDPAYGMAARQIAARLATLPTPAEALAELTPVAVH